MNGQNSNRGFVLTPSQHVSAAVSAHRGTDSCGIVAGCRNGVLVVWHVDPDDLTGKPVRFGAGIAGGVTALACSPGGQRHDGICEVRSCAAQGPLCDTGSPRRCCGSPRLHESLNPTHRGSIKAAS